MSRKKKQSSRERNAKSRNLNSRQESKQISKVSASPLAYWTRLFIFLSTVAGGLILLLTVLLTNWYNETPVAIKKGMEVGGFFIIIMRLGESIRGAKNKSYLISKTSAIIDAILGSIFCVLLTIPALLGTGIIEKITNWVYSAMPIVNQVISRVIVWVLTFAIPSAVSGVIGNFVYDALKKISTTKVDKDS